MADHPLSPPLPSPAARSLRTERHPLALPGFLFLLAVLYGCVSDVTGQETLLWEATIAGSPGQDVVTGSAAAISRASSTEVGISLSGLSEGEYQWRVREGQCDDPGSSLGSELQYPDFEVGGPAPATVETVANAPMLRGTPYHVEIREGASEERRACGNFRPR